MMSVLSGLKSARLYQTGGMYVLLGCLDSDEEIRAGKECEKIYESRSRRPEDCY